MADNTLPFLNGGEPISWAPHISPLLSLIVVLSILAVTVVASLLVSRRSGGHATELPATGAELPEPAADDHSPVTQSAQARDR